MTAIAKPAAKATKPSPKVSANMTVALDHIVNLKDFPYRDIDAAHVETLVNDIKVNGLDTPLFTFATEEGQQVKPKGSDKANPAHFLAAGLHRREAIRKIRREDPKVFEKLFPNGIPVIHRIASAQDMMFLMLRENVQRREMSSEEIFPVLEMLTKEPYSLSGREIAAKIGKSTSWVSQHLAVLEENDELATAAKSGAVDVSDAREIAAGIRKEKKATGTVDTAKVKAKVAVAAAKKTNKVASGNVRAAGDDRKVSAKKLYQRVVSMPKVTLGREVEILRAALSYLAGESEKLPAELRKEGKVSVAPKAAAPAKADAPAAKPAAPAAKAAAKPAAKK